MAEIVGVNSQGTNTTIKFILNESGEKIRIDNGDGADGPIYKGTNTFNKTEYPVIIKSLYLGKDYDLERNIMKLSKSVEASYFLSSIFAGCDPNFSCFNGLICNAEDIAMFKENIDFIPPIKDIAIFISESVEPGRCLMLYEYIDGKDLKKYIQEKIPIDFRVHGIQLLNAVNKLHNFEKRKGKGHMKFSIVHLDIKPPNIMIEKSTNILKIIDLNSICISSNKPGSKCQRQGSTLEYTGLNIHGRENGKQFTINDLLAIDVFSTGITLYEMLTGNSAIKLNAENGMPPIAHKIFWSKIPRELELEFTGEHAKWKDLIESMIKRNPKERITIKGALDKFNDILRIESGWNGSEMLPSEEGGGRKLTKRKRRKTKKILSRRRK